MGYNLEEIGKQYKGGTIAIVGNGPSLVTMPGATAHFQRYIEIGKQRRSGDTKDINEYGPPKAIVKRLDNHPFPLWTINGAWTYHPKSTLGFLMDDHRFHRAETHPQPEWYDQQIKDPGIPIITSKAYDAYPSLVEFPIRDAIKEFRTKYFGETVDYMIALAILFEVKRIQFLGCDYALQDRYPGERAGTEYWIGKAEGRGIEIDATNSQNLMKVSPWDKHYNPDFYGYGADNFPLTEEEITALLKKD